MTRTTKIPTSSDERTPQAVLISDIHYNINTLEIADKALRMAVDKANELDVRLIVAGDLHDTKANMRGECVHAIINTLLRAEKRPIILRGNHDSLNEKSTVHALDFLNPVAEVVSHKVFESYWFIPYQHDPLEFKRCLDEIPKGLTVIMHQGVHGSTAGHYFQDSSAIPSHWLQWHRVISGHYHTRQSIECGPLHGAYLGQLDYLGNPYTLGFGEANDPEKGFQILYDDNTLEFVPTNLRKHQIIELNLDDLAIPIKCHSPQDLLWVKVTGSTEQLRSINKENIAELCYIEQSFKLDLIPTDTKSIGKIDNNAPQHEILDNLIENLSNTDNSRKEHLKQLWRKFT